MRLVRFLLASLGWYIRQVVVSLRASIRYFKNFEKPERGGD